MQIAHVKFSICFFDNSFSFQLFILLYTLMDISIFIDSLFDFVLIVFIFTLFSSLQIAAENLQKVRLVHRRYLLSKNSPAACMHGAVKFLPSIRRLTMSSHRCFALVVVRDTR